MKRRDAFAFRDFDRSRILQRPFFKSFHFDRATDTEILENLKAADSDSVDDMENKLVIIKATHERLGQYQRLIDKHTKRCDRYNKRKSAALGVTLSELKRYAPTLEYFTATLEVVELSDKFAKLYYELEKQIQERYRREFAARLKQARQAAGFTQRQLGELIQISPNGYNHYESGKREPSLPTLSRLLKVFSAKQLFCGIQE